MQSPRHRFLLDWNQRLSNSNQLIRSTDQPISTRAQSWCALSGLIRRLDGSTAEADLRTLPPDSSGPAVHKTASTTIWLYVADRIGSDSFWLCVADAQGIVIIRREESSASLSDGDIPLSLEGRHGQTDTEALLPSLSTGD